MYVSRADLRHRLSIPISVPAGVSNQGMDMRIPVGHPTEGLRHKDATGGNIPAIKGFMKKHCDRVPCTSAELRQKLPVMHEMQPEHLRNTPYPVPVNNRPEELFLKEGCKIKRSTLRALWAETPVLAGEGSEILSTTLLVFPYNLIGDGAPVSVAFCETFVIHIAELFIMGIQQSE